MHLSRGREQWRSCLFLCHSQGETRSPHAYVRVGGHAHVPVLPVRVWPDGHPARGVRATREVRAKKRDTYPVVR